MKKLVATLNRDPRDQSGETPNNRHPVDFSLPLSWANGRCASAAPWLRQSGGDNHDEVAMPARPLAFSGAAIYVNVTEQRSRLQRDIAN
jgi:hypothetical protein